MAKLKFDTLLIDGDVVAFIAAAAVQRTVTDADGNVSAYGELTEGIVAVRRQIGRFRQAFGNADSTVKVILSDRDNWRYEVKADYKDNRDKDGEYGNRPILLNSLKQYLVEEYGAEWLPRLEADDYLSLLATKQPRNDTCIVIGRDKDFKSIPGWHYQILKDDAALEPFFITLPEADRWHLIQAVAGDITDGFSGCPGIGMKRAAEIIDGGHKFVPEHGVITRGTNKGQKTTKWVKVPCANPWEIVVSCYERAGLGEVDALDNARMAHLLRHGEYNLKTGDVKLWQPSM